VLAPTGQPLWVDARDRPGRRDRAVGLRPGLCLLLGGVDGGCGRRDGTEPEQGKRLALATFDGATALAAQSDEPVGALRERVTSKGGTTFAALESMRGDAVADAVVRAVRAAQRRAAELGDTFG
jgi:pyrroline-5-carboxylate reductase